MERRTKVKKSNSRVAWVLRILASLGAIFILRYGKMGYWISLIATIFMSIDFCILTKSNFDTTRKYYKRFEDDFTFIKVPKSRLRRLTDYLQGSSFSPFSSMVDENSVDGFLGYFVYLNIMLFLDIMLFSGITAVLNVLMLTILFVFCLSGVYLLFIRFPNISLVAIPLFGIFLYSFVDTLFFEAPKTSLNKAETDLILILLVTIISLALTWVVDEIVPISALQKAGGVHGVMTLLLVTIIGTVCLQYVFPVIFYASFPEYNPQMVGNQTRKTIQAFMVYKGFGELTENRGVRWLAFWVRKNEILTGESNIFEGINRYWGQYIALAGANIKLTTWILSRKRGKATRLLSKIPMDRMSYDQLKKVAVWGGDKYMGIILSNSHARQIIEYSEKKTF